MIVIVVVNINSKFLKSYSIAKHRGVSLFASTTSIQRSSLEIPPERQSLIDTRPGTQGGRTRDRLEGGGEDGLGGTLEETYLQVEIPKG